MGEKWRAYPVGLRGNHVQQSARQMAGGDRLTLVAEILRHQDDKRRKMGSLRRSCVQRWGLWCRS